MTSAGLEARYRRLLRWFPAEHRIRHGEEMVGVLLAATPPDRQRPGLAEAANLLGSAARMRLRPGRALSDRDGWRDALAIFSITAPVLTVITTGLGYLSSYLWNIAARGTEMSFGFGLYSTHPVLGAVVTMLCYGQAAVAVLVLLGLRRWAALAAGGAMLYLAIFTLTRTSIDPASAVILIVASLPFLWFGLLAEVFALLASAGPRRGRALIRGRHWATVGGGAVAVGVLSSSYDGLGIGRPGAAFAAHVMLGAAVVTLVLTALSLWLAGPTGKRVMVLFALLLFPDIEQVIRWFAGRLLLTFGAFTIAGDALVVVAIAALVLRTRRASRIARRGDGAGLA